MTSSGTFNFQLSNTDVVLEAFDRCEVRPAAITAEHMISAKRSVNLELQTWANLGVNLWCVELITMTLQQGVLTYTLPQEVVSLLDVYIRQFVINETFNVTPNFSTALGSTNINIVVSNHGLVAGNWINIVTPIAIANLLLSGFYQVTTSINSNTFSIASPVAATSTVSSGGAVPLFTATAGQSAIQVTLNNHGQSVNSTFVVGASSSVGGITLFGGYIVTGVIDANNFAIATLQQVRFNDTKSENSGFAQMGAQTSTSDPIDNIMSPLGRTDYAMIPDKYVQGKPTTYWMNRQIIPQVSVWQVPDQNGPYQLSMWAMRRVQDANLGMGETPEIPYRFIDAFCARLARRLAVKYAKPLLTVLEADASRAWTEAGIEDRERADIMILPDLSGYYQD